MNQLDITMLINKAHPLPENFRPDGLIDLFTLENRHFFMLPKQMLLEAEAALALNRMCEEAEREKGLEFLVCSAWRSHEEQAALYSDGQSPFEAAPGCSEHESGLAIDIFPPGEEDDELRHIYWLKDNSWRYGYIARYPRRTEHITGMPYERYHFRYVGKELAAILYENNWTLEEYYDRSIPPTDRYDPAYIFMSIFGPKMKGHWQIWPDIDLSELRKVNPATVGWVHMDGTPIDYPVVGEKLSEAWCLNHNFSGQPSAHGMVRLSLIPETGDLHLMAHNMKDTSMFMKLDELRESGCFDAHPFLELNLEGTRYTARWFAAVLYRGRVAPSMPGSTDPSERMVWLNAIRKKSVCFSNTSVTPADRILVCSSCTEHPDYHILGMYAVLTEGNTLSQGESADTSPDSLTEGNT